MISEKEASNRQGPPPVQIATQAELQFRHGTWMPRREIVQERLAEAGWPAWKLLRFANCGAGCKVRWSEKAQRHGLRASYCHDRHCEPCARAKATRICLNIQSHLATAMLNRYRFVTLTLKHGRQPLREMILKLIRSFKKMRDRPEWKESQVGGVYLLEVKHSDTGWHPHLHIITEGKFLSKHTLSNIWLDVTGDSSIVDIRQPRNLSDLPNYITKYITKGTTPHVMQSQELGAEYILSIKGTRTAGTFGKWRGLKLTAPTEKIDDWEEVCTLDQLVNRARAGEENAWIILKNLKRLDEPPEID